jgi:hypothetical protein
MLDYLKITFILLQSCAKFSSTKETTLAIFIFFNYKFVVIILKKFIITIANSLLKQIILQ